LDEEGGGISQSPADGVAIPTVPEGESKHLEQHQIDASFDQSVNNIAWKTIPSWYLVAQEDQAINPELEQFMANRMGAKTTEIKASHVPFLYHLNEVAELIETAATAKEKVCLF
jgi:hypothetical protein